MKSHHFYNRRATSIGLLTLALGVGACAEDTLRSLPATPLGRGGIEGRLCDRLLGLWVGHATITVDGNDHYTTESDEDGYFVFEDLPGGEYVLLVEAGDYSDQRSAVVVNGQVSNIGASECRPETGRVHGRICDHEAESWARGASIVLETVHGEFAAETDDFGQFDLGAVPVGSHELVALVDDDAQRYPFSLDVAEHLFVGDAGCGPMGALEGRICGGDGYWLANAVVFVETDDGTVVQTITNPDGTFVLTGVPAGTHTVQVARGSFSTQFEVQITGNELTVMPEPVCIPPTTAIAVLTGSYDSIENVLQDLGFPHRARYTGGQASEQVLNEDGNVDIITGSSSTWAANFLGDPLWMAEYDIIFFNCGVNVSSLLTSGGSTGTYLDNLRDFVAAGGSVYASDYASEIVRVAFPERINFYGDNSQSGAARVGESGSYQAVIVDNGLATALGRTNISIDFNMGSWVVMETIAEQPSSLRVMVRANVALSSWSAPAGAPLSVSNAPLLGVFQHGEGRVLYTSFHNSAQITQDMDDVLNYIVFEL